MPKEEKSQKALCAVIVADCYNKCFAPLDFAWAHLPMANRHLFDFTLESVSRSQIKNVIIFASQDVQTVKESISVWSGLFDSVTLIQSQNALSIGDAMRELDAGSHVKSDFMLLPVGAICSDTLNDAILQYRTQQKSDKNSIMTLVYHQADAAHPSRSWNSLSQIVVAYRTDNCKLRYYQEDSRSAVKRNLAVSTDSFKENVRIRTDLSDCQIAICSPQVAALFSDNFDFQTRADMIRDILANEELHGFGINVHVLPPNAYASCVRDFGSYLTVNTQILQRWSYPLVPDLLSSNDAPDSCQYTCKRKLIYLPSKTQIKAAKQTKGNRSIIGPNSSLCENSQIIDSSIGHNCIIGERTKINQSIIWSNVSIGSDCVSEYSILCNDVQVGDNCTIGPRCVIGSQVCVPSDTVIPPGSVLSISISPPDEEYMSCTEFLPGVYQWKNKGKSDGFWPDPNAVSVISQYSESESVGKSARISFDQPDGAGTSAPEDNDVLSFNTEVAESLQRFETVNPSNIIFEINGSKHAYNMSVEDVSNALVKAILSISYKRQNDTGSTLWDSLKYVIQKLSQVLLNYFSSDQVQLNCLAELEDFTMENRGFSEVIMKVIHLMYELDILSEETIINWAEELEGEEAEIIKPKIEPFINWLQEAEEEDDESDC